MGFRPDIQGLRGIAVLIVVLFHAGRLPSGFVGVDIFFVISGFVVTRGLVRVLMQQHESTAAVLLEFYRRRVARLLPAFALVAGPVALASLVLGPASTLAVGLKTAVAGLLLASNAILYRGDGDYFAVGSEANPFLHLWSLSVEEQFYLCVPLLLAVLAIWKAEASLGTKGLWAIGLLSALSLWAALGFTFSLPGFTRILTAPRIFAFYSPITRAWEFGGGALIALVEQRLKLRHLSGLSWIGAGLLVTALATIGARTPFPGWAAIVPVVGAAGLIVAGADERRPWTSGLLRARPLVWLGDLSYAWYLWHWPVIVFFRAWRPLSPWMPVLAGALSLLPAWLSHRFVEAPLRIGSSDSNRLRAIKFRSSIAMGVAALLLSSSALLWLGRSSHPAAGWDVDTQMHVDVRAGCDLSASSAEITGGQCTWGERGRESGPRIVLIGDSNAGQFSEAVIAGGHALGLSVLIRTGSACPLLAGVTGSSSRWAECAELSRRTLDYLRREPPALVVIGVSFAYFRTHPEGVGGLEGDTESARVGFREFLREAGALGHRLVLLAEIPKFRQWPVALCPAWKIWLDGNIACSYSFPLDEVRDVVAENRGYIETLVDAVPNLRVADVSKLLCPGGQCSSHSSATLIYRDGGHLSVQGAERLSPTFVEFLREALKSTVARKADGL